MVQTVTKNQKIQWCKISTWKCSQKSQSKNNNNNNNKTGMLVLEFQKTPEINLSIAKVLQPGSSGHGIALNLQK